MREILFRGKRKDDGGWIKGYVFDDDLIGSSKVFVGAVIIENNELTGTAFCEVIPKTVGQCTGKCDSEAKKIFTDDIVRIDYEIQYGGLKGHPSEIAKVIFEDGCFCMKIFKYADDSLDQRTAIGRKFFFQYGLRITVIGNIHDNPELLEKRKMSGNETY